MKARKLSVCIAGATGAVGQTLIRCLEESNFPVNDLYPLASKNSAGKTLKFQDQDIEIIALEDFDFSLAQIGLFSAGGDVSAIYAPRVAAAGCVVIDNTSHFRMSSEIPLVVPEVNPDDIDHYKNRNIIANPNCSTIQLVVALKPIYDAVGISRINVATYQAVSGSGQKAIDELNQQTKNILYQQSIKNEVYPKQIAFNCLPHIDVFLDNGFTKEEMKIIDETKKIFSDDTLLVNPTAVRVPVVYGHSEAVHIETKAKLSATEARRLLSNAPGVTLMDNPADISYPTTLDCIHKNDVFIGRVREDLSHPMGLNLWVVSDNLRKGAATNSVQIAEILADKYL